ncbi:HlyD family secretion protein [Benzoatithermus flavus]|uniref:HlyD family efflux transporter periplasmic adaptor subunit n=1 Tax=Benzoatithermus flavus TaxID=3108223 RepID=A0ABU8XKF2_9PROT
MSRVAALFLILLLAACERQDGRWLQGYAEGEYLRLAAPEAGWVESLAVQRGDRVEAGAPLFALEAGRQRAAVREAEAGLARAEAQLADLKQGKRPEEIAEIEAELAQARATAAYAEQDLRRQEKLARSDVAAEARLDQARSAADAARARVAAMEAQLAAARLPARADQIAAASAAVESARAALAQARWQLDQRTVRAPAAALVEDTLRKPGEWVPAGGIVVSLLPPGNVKVRFFVPETALAGIRVGQRVGLRCDGCAAGLAGTVRYVAPEAEFTPPVIYSIGRREKLVFLVEAWPDEGVVLHPGQPVDVAVGTG